MLFMLESTKSPPQAVQRWLGLAELVQSPVSSAHPLPWGRARLLGPRCLRQNLTWAVGQVWPQAETCCLMLFSFGDCFFFFLLVLLGSPVPSPSAHADSARVSFLGGCPLLWHCDGDDPSALAAWVLGDTLGGSV